MSLNEFFEFLLKITIDFVIEITKILFYLTFVVFICKHEFHFKILLCVTLLLLVYYIVHSILSL